MIANQITRSELKTLFAYDAWATSRLLEVVAGLSVEEYQREFAGPTTSIRNRAVHLLVALHRWCAGCLNEPTRSVEEPPSETPAELMNYAALVRGVAARCAERTTEARLAETVEFPRGSDRSIPWGEALRHVVNHGTYHRGQIATLLTLLGLDFPDTDYVYWLAETGGA